MPDMSVPRPFDEGAEPAVDAESIFSAIGRIGGSGRTSCGAVA